MTRLSALLLLILSTPSLASTTDLYRDAKAAYGNDDCQKAVVLLEEYEQQPDSDHGRFAAINSAIAWCRSQLFAVAPHPNVDGDTVGGTPIAHSPATPRKKPPLPN